MTADHPNAEIDVDLSHFAEQVVSFIVWVQNTDPVGREQTALIINPRISCPLRAIQASLHAPGRKSDHTGERSDKERKQMHIWQIGEHAWAAIVALVTHEPCPVEHYRQLLGGIPELQHVTIEVSVCGGPPCIPVNESRR